MSDPAPAQPFFLIVADFDAGRFSVEGPMLDDRPWKDAVRRARHNERRHIVCGPTGPDPDALASDFQREHRIGGAPPGTIVRPRG